MTRHRRRHENRTGLLCGLLALLLLTSPGLSWKTSYRCLITGEADLSECCGPPEPAGCCKPVSCCEKDRPVQVHESGCSVREQGGMDPCGCCEVIVTRLIPRVPTLKTEGSGHLPALALLGAMQPIWSSVPFSTTRAKQSGIGWSRAGPHRYLLFSSLLI